MSGWKPIKGAKRTMLGKRFKDGFVVIGAIKQDGNILILTKSDKKREYVTAYINHENDNEWYWGRYHTRWDTARKDFSNRME
jgi:hypothetical protein